MSNDILHRTELLLIKTEGMGYVGRSVSNEGVMDTLKSLVGVFSTKLANLKSAFTGNSERLKEIPFNERDMNVYARELVRLRPRVQNIVQTIQYSNVMDYKLVSISKLDKNFKDTANIIDGVYKEMDKKLESHLDNLDILLSNVIGDEGFRTSSRPFKPDTEAKKYSDELKNTLYNLFKSKRMEDVDKLKNIYPNMKSILETFDTLVSISSSPSINKLRDLNKYCTDIESKIDAMISDIKDKRLVVSKSVLVKLSEDLESVANIVTMSVSFAEVYSRLVLCVKNHIDYLYNESILFKGSN